MASSARAQGRGGDVSAEGENDDARNRGDGPGAVVVSIRRYSRTTDGINSFVRLTFSVGVPLRDANRERMEAVQVMRRLTGIFA